MRLWHKDLIPVLPRQQLLSQWRECCCIAKNIAEKGTPDHILVNKIMDYPQDHFYTYAFLVRSEMERRGYKVDKTKFKQCSYWKEIIDEKRLFEEWHNYRYLNQCYYNLQEKYDCGGLTVEEWNKVHNKVLFT